MQYHIPPFYQKGSAYEQWLYTCLFDLLALPAKESISLLDLAAGTGRTAELLNEKHDQNFEITCVDNSQVMLDQIKTKSNITIVNNDLIKYIESVSSKKFDRIIVKEAIHFIPLNGSIVEFSQNAYRSLTDGGLIVVCTRPKQDIKYPLSKNLLAQWDKSQGSIETYIKAFENSGFTVNLIEKTFMMKVDFESWKVFLENRVWSIFNRQIYADCALAEEIAEIRHKYFQPNKEYIFEERLIFLQCLK